MSQASVGARKAPTLNVFDELLGVELVLPHAEELGDVELGGVHCVLGSMKGHFKRSPSARSTGSGGSSVPPRYVARTL